MTKNIKHIIAVCALAFSVSPAFAATNSVTIAGVVDTFDFPNGNGSTTFSSTPGLSYILQNNGTQGSIDTGVNIPTIQGGNQTLLNVPKFKSVTFDYLASANANKFLLVGVQTEDGFFSIANGKSTSVGTNAYTFKCTANNLGIANNSTAVTAAIIFDGGTNVKVNTIQVGGFAVNGASTSATAFNYAFHQDTQFNFGSFGVE